MRKWTKMLMLMVGMSLLAAAGCKNDVDNPILPSTEINQDAAKVFCYGASCDGKDPIAMGCSADARTPVGAAIPLYWRGQKVGLLELRYSPACAANWAKVTRYQGSVGYLLKADVYGQNWGHQPFQLQGYSNIYTNMVEGIQKAAASGMVCMGPIVGMQCSEAAGGGTNWY